MADEIISALDASSCPDCGEYTWPHIPHVCPDSGPRPGEPAWLHKQRLAEREWQRERERERRGGPYGPVAVPKPAGYCAFCPSDGSRCIVCDTDASTPVG